MKYLGIGFCLLTAPWLILLVLYQKSKETGFQHWINLVFGKELISWVLWQWEIGTTFFFIYWVMTDIEEQDCPQVTYFSSSGVSDFSLTHCPPYPGLSFIVLSLTACQNLQQSCKPHVGSLCRSPPSFLIKPPQQELEGKGFSAQNLKIHISDSFLTNTKLWQ
jgi:hypothetical protein